MKSMVGTVQMITAIIDRDLLMLSIDRELTMTDPVRPTTDNGAKIVTIVDVGTEVAVTEQDIGKLSVAVRRPPRHQGRSQRADGDVHAL